MHQLAQLLEAEGDLAARKQRADRHAGRCLYKPIADLALDAPAREKLLQCLATRPGRVSDARRGAYRCQQCCFAIHRRSRRATRHRDRDTRVCQRDHAAGDDAASVTSRA